MQYIQQRRDSSGDTVEPRTTLMSRNITVMGRRTSIRLEPEMWKSLQEIADIEECTIHDICTLVAYRRKQGSSLTAAIRVFLMLYFKAASTDDGHAHAGHGSFLRMAQRARIPHDILPALSLNANLS